MGPKAQAHFQIYSIRIFDLEIEGQGRWRFRWKVAIEHTLLTWICAHKFAACKSSQLFAIHNCTTYVRTDARQGDQTFRIGQLDRTATRSEHKSHYMRWPIISAYSVEIPYACYTGHVAKKKYAAGTVPELTCSSRFDSSVQDCPGMWRMSQKISFFLRTILKIL